MKVPAGFKFMEASAARNLLQGLNQPVPEHLLGLLAQEGVKESDSWWVVLQWMDLGHLENPEAAQLNPTEILSRLRSQVESQNADRRKQGLPTYSDVQWELKPEYTAADHILGWAVRKQNAAQPVVSRTVRLFCRRGALDATVVIPYHGFFSEPLPLRRLFKDIVLKAGERYEDFQAGDKVCALGLAALIDSENVAATPLAAVSDASPGGASRARSRWIWVSVGVVAFAGVLGGALMLNRAGRRKAGTIQRVKRTAVPLAPAAINAGQSALPAAAVSKAATPPAARPVLAKAVTPVLRPANAGTNGKPVNGKRHGQRGRKVFDYNRYFTDLMGAVSSHSTQMDMPANGVPLEGARIGGDLPPQESAPSKPGDAVGHHAQLMASQRELIEEQKRLIQEQNKLIEEKSKLIAEKNALLKMQSQLMEDKLL